MPTNIKCLKIQYSKEYWGYKTIHHSTKPLIKQKPIPKEQIN
jgi:hypothetical protein